MGIGAAYGAWRLSQLQASGAVEWWAFPVTILVLLGAVGTLFLESLFHALDSKYPLDSKPTKS